ncbi:MAG: zinc ribbon domain-containing protein YjdM [Polyangiales bacterium]
MSAKIACPVCSLEDVVEVRDHYECVTCGHEWPREQAPDAPDGPRVVKDAYGNVLVTGDDVVLIKDLKLKGSSTTLKGGTKVKRIRIVDEGDHEVDCKVDGMSVMLKACFLKKA